MDLEKIIPILVTIHAAFGGVAILAGAIALIAKKGGRIHKKAGMTFFVTMLISTLMSFIVAIAPQHENPFLFSIGLFSIYFLISGYRSLKFKQREFDLKMDKIMAYLIIVIGLTMVLYPIILNGQMNVVLLVFGLVGVLFGWRDLSLYNNREKLKEKWLSLHLGKITGGYIAAITAFFVVNQILPGVWNWFTPGIVGSFYIAYWIRKVG